MRLTLSVSLAFIVITVTQAAAIETCRHIQDKTEREACYHRQEEELAARRKPDAAPAPSAESKTLQSLQQMRRDDAEVYRSIRGICNGC